jgi:universal stress protein A
MYQRILVATDLSEHGNETVRKAWELANQFDARLYIVHAIEPIPAYGYEGITVIESPYIDHAKDELKKLADNYSIPEENQFTLIGPIKFEVLNKAKELNADLIVVGSHGHHGLTRLLGSTANAIMHGAECDIVMVRKK